MGRLDVVGESRPAAALCWGHNRLLAEPPCLRQLSWLLSTSVPYDTQLMPMFASQLTECSIRRREGGDTRKKMSRIGARKTKGLARRGKAVFTKTTLKGAHQYAGEDSKRGARRSHSNHTPTVTRP